jgi:pyruvate formate lyase activating enzyme
LPEKFGPTLPDEEFFSFLMSRKGKISGVCVSGGEPTLHKELPEFLSRIKAMGFAVKLDTNGYRPDVLLSLIESGLVDYVAMDIKNSPERYGETVGLENFDIEPIKKSVEILLSDKVEYEFRTTVMRELHTESDIAEMGRLCRGAKKYFLQSFRDSGDLIGEGFTAYSEAEMKCLQKTLSEFVPFAQVRG